MQDSDGTVILYFSKLSGGTRLTVEFCTQELKPYLLIDASKTSKSETVEHILAFIKEFEIQVLNVAGPRASNSELAYPYTKTVITEILRKKSYQ